MTVATESAISALVNGFPAAAKDIKLNLKTVLTSTALSQTQVWGTALACAYNEGNQALIDALMKDGAESLNDALVSDAQSVAALMSMNNVYYRFRHMVGKAEYNQIPARLRMTAMARPKTDRQSFELFSLAVSAINGCEQCIKSHEKILIDSGLKEEAINDAIRIAAVVRAASVSLNFSN